MWFYYFRVGLTYVTIGVAAAVFFFFVVKKPVLGKLWGALIVGLVGSFLGGLMDQLFSRVDCLSLGRELGERLLRPCHLSAHDLASVEGQLPEVAGRRHDGRYRSVKDHPGDQGLNRSEGGPEDRAGGPQASSATSSPALPPILTASRCGWRQGKWEGAGDPRLKGGGHEMDQGPGSAESLHRVPHAGQSNVRRSPMFGYPAFFIKKNMFAGLFQDQLFLRLSPDQVRL